MLPGTPARQRPNRRRSGFLFALVIVLGVAFYFTYTAIRPGGQPWSYSRLVSEAQAGQVTSLEIRGTQGVAIDKSGSRHPVTLPADSAPLATQLARQGVNVSYRSGDNSTLLQVLIPNLLLLVLIGGFYYLARRARNRPGPPAIT